MMRLTVQDRNLGGRTQPRYCDFGDCGAPTREGKPLCPEHVLEWGYARKLHDIVRGSELEIKRVAKAGPKAVDLNGLVVDEIMAGLRNAGKLTWRRLIKDHVNTLNMVDAKTANCYLTRLKREGFVVVSLSDRNYEVVTLTEKGHENWRPIRVD